MLEETQKAVIKKYDILHVYVDGAFSTLYPDRYAGAFLVIDPTTGDIIEAMNGCGRNKKALPMRNVAGELSATMRGTQYSLRIAKQVIIFYDYQGIEDWLTGAWSCKKEQTRAYFNFMFRYLSPINRLQFVKVKAHSGDVYNERVDQMAKLALKQGKEW